jgi:hypothetical protein
MPSITWNASLSARLKPKIRPDLADQSCEGRKGTDRTPAIAHLRREWIMVHDIAGRALPTRNRGRASAQRQRDLWAGRPMTTSKPGKLRLRLVAPDSGRVGLSFAKTD